MFKLTVTSRKIWQAFGVAIAIAISLSAASAAFAGECPADKIKPNARPPVDVRAEASDHQSCDCHADRAGIDRKTHRSGRYIVVLSQGWQDRLSCKEVDNCQERSEADHQRSKRHAGGMAVAMHDFHRRFRRHIGHHGQAPMIARGM